MIGIWKVLYIRVCVKRGSVGRARYVQEYEAGIFKVREADNIYYDICIIWELYTTNQWNRRVMIQRTLTHWQYPSQSCVEVHVGFCLNTTYLTIRDKVNRRPSYSTCIRLDIQYNFPIPIIWFQICFLHCICETKRVELWWSALSASGHIAIWVTSPIF